MGSRKKVLFFTITFVVLLSLSYGNRVLYVDIVEDNVPLVIHQKYDQVIIPQCYSKLDKLLRNDFFRKNFTRKNLTKAVELAQIEDFDNQYLPLVSEEMNQLMRKEELNSRMSLLVVLETMSDHFSKQSKREKTKSIEKWRGYYLEKIEQYLRYLSSLKPSVRCTLVQTASYDSNLNRVPDTDLPSEHTGKDDLQSLSSLQTRYQPWINAKNKKHDILFSGSLAYLTHEEHTENDMLNAIARSRYDIRTGGIFEKVGVQYQLIYLGLSGDEGSRQMSNYYHQHTVSVHGDLVDSEPLFEWIEKAKLSYSLSYSKKYHYDSTRSVNDSHRREARVSQILLYGQKKPKRIIMNLRLGDTQTEHNENLNFSGYTCSLSHSHPLSLFTKNIYFREAVSYGLKRFGEYLGGKQIEKVTTYSVSAMIPFTKNVMTQLKWDYSSKRNNVNVQLLDPLSLEAEQQRVTIGFFWSL